MTAERGTSVLGSVWPWPLTDGYPEPYPCLLIGDREVYPDVESLNTQACRYHTAPYGLACTNAPEYLARYDCGEWDEAGLVCADHALKARTDIHLLEIRRLHREPCEKTASPSQNP